MSAPAVARPSDPDVEPRSRPAARRLALVGAFPFVVPQGSQVFLRDQALALADAGARPVVLTYGRGPERPPEALSWRPIARWLSPRRTGSGPSPGKLLADPALVARVVWEHRREPFDAMLAHNVEGALVALAVRARTGIPVVYVAHTLMGHELGHYGPPWLARGLDGLGGWLDRFVASRADAVIALSESARVGLSSVAAGPIERIPPGRPAMPQADPKLAHTLARRLGIETGRFALYTGNLDRYQGLDRLARAARRLDSAGVPVIAATHAPDRRHGKAEPGPPGLRVHRAASAREVMELVRMAGVLLLPRRSPGGFPIKLLNYLDSGRPVVALASGAGDLTDDVDGVVLPDTASADDIASAVERLLADPERARRIGIAGRDRIRRHHDWADLARRTADLVERVILTPR